MGSGERLQTGTFSGLEDHLLSERVGHDENVAEKDGGVEAKPPDRLKRGFCGQRGRIAEIDEIIRPSL